MANIEHQAVEALRADTAIRQKLESGEGMPWFGVQQFLIDHLPEQLEDRRQFAYNLVPKALNTIFGPQPEKWETFKSPNTGKTWIRAAK
jgi:hypothetical protein